MKDKFQRQRDQEKERLQDEYMEGQVEERRLKKKSDTEKAIEEILETFFIRPRHPAKIRRGKRERLNEKDPLNCPLCEAEVKGHSEGWGLSPAGWEEIERRHLKEHCTTCPICGQTLKIASCKEEK